MPASTAEERNQWVACIQSGIQESPFDYIITCKKNALRRNAAAFPHVRASSHTTPTKTPTKSARTPSSGHTLPSTPFTPILGQALTPVKESQAI